MKKKILIVNGVNLSELGSRETNLYGQTDFDSYFCSLQKKFPDFELHYFQSNSLDKIVDNMLSHKNFDGIILNPGAYTHTSIVLADTIKAIPVKVVEVHISNLFAREEFRKKSYIASTCAGSISGFGLKGYELALFSFND